MGQTLTHGIYLPDEGERNCYSGLAANWQILDSSVGTIAEHTSQIAGKAPAVHTHTKADITDFPAYGNTAGTICEGNDSRLSDARTPVAHTHTKSDITDLFNSANTWTGSNQYNVSVKFNGQTGINWARGGTTGTLPSSVLYYGFQNALDSNDNVFDRIRSYIDTAGTNFQEHVKYAWNDLTKYVTINYWINADGSDSEYKLSVKRLVPVSSNATDLGTSTNKWKTFNGVNPGALSLPEYTLAKVDLIDFSQWSVAGQRNEYTPVSDGWLFVNIKDTASNSIFIYAHSLYNADPKKDTTYSVSCFGNGSQGLNGRIAVMLPVRAGIVYGIFIKAASVSEIWSARFYPALGNV